MLGQDFYVFISGLCKDTVGHQFIERGDFRMLHGNQLINPLEFPDSVTSGMTIEMSIVVRRNNGRYNAKDCPRCGHINNISIDDGWMEWEVVSNSIIVNN